MAARAEMALHPITRAVVAQGTHLLFTYSMIRIFLSQAVAEEEAEVTQGVSVMILMVAMAVAVVAVVSFLADASLVAAEEALAWIILLEPRGLMAVYISVSTFKEVRL